MFDINHLPWCNHTVLEEKRLAVRTVFFPASSPQAAMAGDTDRVTNLSGMWDFRHLTDALSVTAEVIGEEPAPGNGYAPIKVPRSWQFAGYGRFMYTDEAYPFPVDPPFVPAEHETGVYKRVFMHEPVSGGRVILRLDGVESCAQVYVNETYCGYTQGSRLPAEFDITQACLRGENRLTLVVHQYCDGTYLEDQDMWWLGGIIRDVLLIERREAALENLILDADFDPAAKTGLLRIRADVSGGTAEFRLYGSDGNEALCGTLHGDDRFTLPGAVPWNAEESVLYTLLVTVSRDGRCLEAVRQRIGFRRVEISGGALLINGVRVMLRGVNRHEYSPEDGRAVTREQTLADLRLMKRRHINAVRTSHYPNAPYFYDLCDELGLYVMDECDLETHGFEIEGIPYRLADDPTWEAAYLDRAVRTVGRDRNHACVILWSLGNESRDGRNFRAMYDWIHAADHTRPIHYEGDSTNAYADVTSTMYTSVGALYELDRAPILKPHILCEFAHAMGNGPGSLSEYIGLCENARRIQGYFVWEWRDHGIRREDSEGRVRYLFGGEQGEDYSSGNFCMDGLLASDGTPTPGFYAYAKAIEPLYVEEWTDEALCVASRLDFRTVRSGEARLTVRRDGEPVLRRTLPLPALLPRGSVCLPCSGLLKAEDNALWTVRAELYENDLFLGAADKVLRGFSPRGAVPAGNIALECREGGYNITGDLFSLRISLADGRIHGWRHGGREVLTLGPSLDIFRAYLDNDRVPARRWQEKHLHSMAVTVKTAAAEEADGCVILRFTGTLGANARNWRILFQYEYRVFADGTVAMTVGGTFDGDFGLHIRDEVPRIGTTSRLPAALQSVVYEGFGPDESYVDSRQQARFDVFHTAVDQLAFPYESPQDSGNRTGTELAAFTGEGGHGVAFAALAGMDMQAHTCTAADLWRAAHYADLPKRDFIELHYDLINSGLGSGSCGPQHLAAYSAPTRPFRMWFAIAPVTGGEALFAGRHAQEVLRAWAEEEA